MPAIIGNTEGLKAHQLKALQRLYSRRFPQNAVFTLEQAQELATVSQSIHRQVALCIDRKGKVVSVIVGTTTGILIPEQARTRESAERLRGFRILHTHLDSHALSTEDCMDMLFLRLDSMAVLFVNQDGQPTFYQHAHLLPANKQDEKYRVYPKASWDKVNIDPLAEVLALEEEFSKSTEFDLLGPSVTNTVSDEEIVSALQNSKAICSEQKNLSRAILIHVSSKSKEEQKQSLLELIALASTADIVVCGILQQKRDETRQDILGQSKLTELEVLALQNNAQILLFDGELSSSQLRFLADQSKRKVLDRTQLILDIFAKRARSQAGKYQVELAQLQYMLPRLRHQNKAFDRLAGGIGGRGPGETKLETDKRRIRKRISYIKEYLDLLRARRAATRARRAKNQVPVAAFVGYTNTGKSSLLNSITQSTTLAENKLFATLDPSSRRLHVADKQEIILTDTVGFIQKLPKELMQAFQATLEELSAAELLVHVADPNHPACEAQISIVHDILAELKLLDTPHILVFSKLDLLSPEQHAYLQREYPEALFISSLTRQGLSELIEKIYALCTNQSIQFD